MRLRLGSWTLFLIALLAFGLLMGRWFWTSSDLSQAASFRVWWWGHRELDIAVQVGLVLAGALGIAALMPPEGEETE